MKSPFIHPRICRTVLNVNWANSVCLPMFLTFYMFHDKHLVFVLH